MHTNFNHTEVIFSSINVYKNIDTSDSVYKWANRKKVFISFSMLETVSRVTSLDDLICPTLFTFSYSDT